MATRPAYWTGQLNLPLVTARSRCFRSSRADKGRTSTKSTVRPVTVCTNRVVDEETGRPVGADKSYYERRRPKCGPRVYLAVLAQSRP